MASFAMPGSLVAACREDGREPWLQGLGEHIEGAARRWSLTLAEPFEPGGQTAWVAPAHSVEFGDVVLKIGWWHMEGADEAAGLRAWGGDGAVRVFADERLTPSTTALVLERCEPGTTLAEQPEEEQDLVIAELLPRLWHRASEARGFRPLQAMCDYWADSFEKKLALGNDAIDPGIARQGVALFRTLPGSASEQRLLCTDLHAGNVLASQREPWLVIDPKPFVGDPTYDALQHLLNCEERLLADPEGLVARFAGLLGLDADRLLAWLFARCVVESAGLPGWSIGVAERIRP